MLLPLLWFMFQGGPAPEPVQQNPGGVPYRGFVKTRIQKEIEKYQIELKGIPKDVKVAIKKAVEFDDREERERVLREKLEGVENKFLDIYIQYLDIIYSRMLDNQIRLELKRIEQEQEDEAIILLLML